MVQQKKSLFRLFGALSLVAAFALSGCEGGDCTFVGNECADGEICDVATGNCLAACTEDSCEQGQVCNSGTQLCEADCTIAGNECTGGKSCDATTKVCVAVCGAGTCGSTEVCDTTSGQCVARCDAATDPTVCEGDTVCAASGACVAFCDAATGATECTGGQVCNPASHKCQNSCETAGCMNDEFCNLTGAAAGLCVAECPAPTAALRTFPDKADDTCRDAATLAQCVPATKRTATVDVPGPTAFNARVTAFRAPAGAEVGPCAASAKIAVVQVDYLDSNGDFPTSNLYQKVRVVNSSGSDSVTFDSIRKIGTTTATSGTLEFSLCVASTPPVPFAVFLVDDAGNKGNSACFEAK